MKRFDAVFLTFLLGVVILAIGVSCEAGLS